jgi:hypothetical protein
VPQVPWQLLLLLLLLLLPLLLTVVLHVLLSALFARRWHVLAAAAGAAADVHLAAKGAEGFWLDGSTELPVELVR